MNRTRPAGEQLIGALIPAVHLRPPLPPAPLPALPARRERGDGRLLIDAARVDPSGRVWVTTLLRALGWAAGRRVDIDCGGHALVFRAAPAGKHAVGTRGSLALPAPHRQMTAIDIATTVILVASPVAGTLHIYPVTVVGQFLHQLVGDPHGR